MFVLRREYRPTDQDYLTLTLLIEKPVVIDTTSSYAARMHLREFLVAMRKVRPDLMEWLTNGMKAKGRDEFTEDQREYGKALYDDYRAWLAKQYQATSTTSTA
jgi:hypothetical protein